MRENVVQRRLSLASRSDPVRIYALGDLHLGNALCDETLLERTVREIAEDPHAYWVGLGDYADFITRRDPRHRESRMARWLWGKDDTAVIQRERVMDILSPIAPKCLALVKGNHEDSILQYHEVDVYYALTERLKALGAPNPLALGPGGFVRLAIQRGEDRKSTRTVILYLHHGYLSGKLAGSIALELERLPAKYEFDIAFLGHAHRQMVAVKVPRQVSTGGGRIVYVPKVAVQNGTFLLTHGTRGKEGYGELRGFYPAQLGAARVDIWAFRGTKGELEVRVVL